MSKLLKSLILNTDSYKISMWKQLPKGTESVYSYIESRGGRYDRTVFFGLQAFIKEYLLEPITQADIDIADEILTAHGEPFNREGWQYILDKHQGFLPIVINAVPEGTVVPVKNVLATVENTDPKVPWLTTYVETAILRAVWYGTTVATQSYTIKQVILDYLERTGDPTTIDFKLHDFGGRGVSSLESAGLGAAAHLVSFMGTDTITGVLHAREYYGSSMAGFSIPASEHSISTSFGRDERAYALNMIEQFAKPGAIFAMVADTYNVFEFCKMIGRDPEIREKIDAHAKTGGMTVIRPDSGDPVEVNMKLIEILGHEFGYTVNAKGFKVLNSVRLIQGDGVNELSIRSILGAFMAMGWSADNIAFGMGGGLLQQVDRDTQKFAMKAASTSRRVATGLREDGPFGRLEHFDIVKDPITDPGKKSKTGRVTLWDNGAGEFQSSVTQPNTWTDKGMEWKESLVLVYWNGNLHNEITFDQVRANSRK